MSKLLLETAKLDKTGPKSTVVSSQFDDIYFNQTAGIDESNYVFIEANHLAERFQLLNTCQDQHFFIAELGFGSGLNFLNTLTCWQKQLKADSKATLHFLSCEKYPLPSEDFKSIVARWHDIFDQLDILVDHYPPPIRGVYSISFEAANVHLHLVFDDVDAFYEHINTSKLKIDAWFLDGFAPNKNPSMWQSKNFTRMAFLSNDDCTLSTFTAASKVRHALNGAGFSMTKRKGFGRKREMLVGKLEKKVEAPKFSSLPPWLSLNYPEQGERHATIVGAGIAGCTLAYELTRRDWRVTLIEASEAIAGAASGNPSALVYPSISLDLNRATELYLNAFHYAYRFYHALNKAQPNVIQAEGLLFSAKNQQRICRLLDLSLPEWILQPAAKAEQNNFFSESVETTSVYFPHALTISPSLSCQRLIENGGSQIDVKRNTNVEGIERQGQHWLLKTNKGELKSQTLILCAGAAMNTLFRDSSNWGQIVRGQIDSIEASGKTAQLKQSLSYGGYLSACWQNRHVLGASFQPDDIDAKARDEDYLRNLQLLRENHPELAGELQNYPHQSRVSFRFCSQDHLPIVGPIADQAEFLRTFHDIRKGKQPSKYDPPNWHQNLYIFSALGSKGFLTAPILARYLAALLDKEPLPLQAHLLASLHPHRFDVKTLFRSD